MPKYWKIVGGADKGGIMVREGEGFKSTACADRLSTGAVVEELKMAGERLNYRLNTGTGPEEGWISIVVSGKVLAEPTSAPAEAEAPAAFAGEKDPEADKKMIEERCQKEWARTGLAQWSGVSMEQFQANYMKEEKGMRYGMNFPHTPELLTSSKYGAAWMTKAFHAAGTIPKDNKVSKIIGTKPLTGGGACLKALIEIQYAKPDPNLATKLFMKYPFDYENKLQRSDRMNSSVMIQGMEIAEIDSYRLLECYLPFPMPRFYFGDVSNETTNFIIITDLVKWGDKKKKLADFKPFEVEPAYDKFLDDDQFENPIEYYRLMTSSNATMAGWYKAGKFGTPEELGYFFPDGSQGAPPPLQDAELQRKIKMGEEFITNVGKVLFPKDLLTDWHVKEWKRVLALYNCYSGEAAWFAGANPDYTAIMHGNMNPDNTWWWRNEQKELQIGVLDWGGLSKVAFGPKLWWSYYACEFHMLENHLDELLQLFIDTYAKEGGTALDKEILRRDFFLSALNQAVGILGAIPMIYRVIPKKVWDTVKDRHDQRLQDNFLTRMYVMGFVLIYTMIFRFDLGKVVEDFVKHNGLPEKPVPAV